MPIYEYRCPNGHTFEVFQRMTDDPVERCEECGASPVEKVLFPVAVHFKGSGFYSTDYGKGSRKGGKETGGAEGAGSAPDKKDTKSEPAATTSDTSKPKPNPSSSD